MPPVFLRYQIARIFLIFGLQMQSVAVGWRLYEVTGDPMELGWVGLVQFLPVLLLWPLTGTVSDRYDRRWIATLCVAGHVGVALTLARGATPGLMLTLLGMGAFFRAFAAPAQQSLLPSLVSKEQFPRAVALNSSIFQVGSTVGPALGGALYGKLSAEGVFYVSAALLAIATVLLASLPPARGGEVRSEEGVWARVGAGLKYIQQRPLILGAISLDLFAVLLGGAVALLPVYAKDILHAGPEGLGLLRAGPAVGATLTALTLSRWPVRRHAGKVLLGVVALFGLATVVFGLSKNLWLSLAALVVLGASDEVSVFIRQTLVQLNTPNGLRGRVSAVNFLFISVSNEVGQFESGLTAAWMGPVAAVVAGGLGAMGVAGAYWMFAPALRNADRLLDAKNDS